MKYTYTPKNVCSTNFEFDIENNIIKSCKITNGCPGNTMGVSKLIVGKTVDEVIKILKDIDCRGRGTSCPDQIAIALMEYKKK
ncbi:MAG: TIGR03905 family TSCPD domain-containing protein [Mycoplasmoidaceae bacterium]|nr:TIGR03905 family TSCPD domain-containing protein [Mycoplasmoidaceae bacterium]